MARTPRRFYDRLRSLLSGPKGDEQRSQPRGRFWRKPFLEVLEDRTLLDGGLIGSALSNAQTQTLLSGLHDVAGFTNNLAQVSLLAQKIPIVDQSIGSALNISDLIQTRLVTPLQGATITSTDNFVTAGIACVTCAAHWAGPPSPRPTTSLPP
jgi:hypothetical protein